ncbi:MAG: hypothetical protein QNI84_13305 [Henriciella sp.]|nr:hypothetical protein [Henriciella sp.]
MTKSSLNGKEIYDLWYLEGLTDQEIATRHGMTRHMVTGKRFRYMQRHVPDSRAITLPGSRLIVPEKYRPSR